MCRSQVVPLYNVQDVPAFGANRSIDLVLLHRVECSCVEIPQKVLHAVGNMLTILISLPGCVKRKPKKKQGAQRYVTGRPLHCSGAPA
jgi:hypothetical protein